MAKLIYQRFPNTGAAAGASIYLFYDFDKREEKTLLANARPMLIPQMVNHPGTNNSGGFGIIKPDS